MLPRSITNFSTHLLIAFLMIIIKLASRKSAALIDTIFPRRPHARRGWLMMMMGDAFRCDTGRFVLKRGLQPPIRARKGQH